MGNIVLPTTRFVLPLLQALDPRQKWLALRSYSGSGRNWDPWLSWTLGIMIGLGGAVVLLALAKHLLANGRQNRFKVRSRQMGLNSEQMKLLTDIAKLSALQHSDGIFHDPSAFASGVERLMGSGKAASLSQQERQKMCSLIGVVQDKLKFSGEGKSSTPGRVSTRNIPEAGVLRITRRSGESAFEAKVVASNRIEFTVQTAESVPATPGNSWLISYLDNDSNWEFECTVTHSNSQRTRIILVHSHRSRLINRRRFPRIPTIKSARIAHFSFTGDEEVGELKGLEFKEATLIEIAGPGFKLRTKLQAEIGQKVLVIVKAEEKTIRSVAIVRHVWSSKEGQDEFEIAVELIGLDQTEIAAMMRETNEAQRQLKSESESSEPLQPVAAAKGD